MDGNSHAVFTLMEDVNGNLVSSQLRTGYNFMDEPVKETKFIEEHVQWPIGKLREHFT